MAQKPAGDPKACRSRRFHAVFVQKEPAGRTRKAHKKRRKKDAGHCPEAAEGSSQGKKFNIAQAQGFLAPKKLEGQAKPQGHAAPCKPTGNRGEKGEVILERHQDGSKRKAAKAYKIRNKPGSDVCGGSGNQSRCDSGMNQGLPA